MKRAVVQLAVCVGLVAAVPALARAQSRPLVTEDPETVPAGFVLLEAGFDYLRGAVYPVSGFSGNLWRIGTFGLSFGVSSIAEIQVDGGLRSRLDIKNINTAAPLPGFAPASLVTSASDDFTIGAKVRFVSETAGRPAFALRFATRLPTASVESGLATNTFDFNIGLAVAKTAQSIRVAGNVGLGLLGDPVQAGSKNHVINVGLSVARAVATGVEFVGEINGRFDLGEGEPPPGAESRSTTRVGARLTRGPVRLDAGFLVGLTDRDPDWGLTFGATWVFKGFEVK